ncbi:MAG: hypothetical protein ACQET7_06375 [Thermodesulfobacteriota bacterium]
MDTVETPNKKTWWREDPFGFIPPESFESLGIDPGDIPAGTFAAHRHPSQIESRFGGNAYGFGLFEVSDRLSPEDLELLQSFSEDDSDYIRRHYRELNRIYKSLGLLIRFTRKGRPFYLVPAHLVSVTISNIRYKAEEISKVIDFHRRKFLKESHRIGLITHADDLLINDLSLRFKEHSFVVFDSLEKLRIHKEPLDLVILTRDPHEVLVMERFLGQFGGNLSKTGRDRYVRYLLGKIYRALKPDGEIYIIANHYAQKTNQSVKVTFKTNEEKKKFLLFSHIFRTRRKYQVRDRSERIHAFDFQKYLRGVYVEKEVIDRLLGHRDLDDMTTDELASLPYLNYRLDEDVDHDQEKTWNRLLSVFFDEISFKRLLPAPLKSEWRRRFSAAGLAPRYKLTYLGQKKPLVVELDAIRAEIDKSRLAGCPLELLADYRDSFEYVLGTLEVLGEIKSKLYSGLPEVFMARLRQPFENRRRRYAGLNDVLRLMSRVKTLERVRSYLNPDGIEGANTPILQHLEVLPFFGLSAGELREIYLIVAGHTTMGRVLSGKMTEKALKPLSDLARKEEQGRALNLLRYCRLMTMAETVASRGSELRSEHLAELFDLYESVVRVVTNREMDWDRLLDEKISQMGGIHNMIVRKVLKLMDLVDHFEFLDSWAELRLKGDMEKESLADYDPDKLQKIENILKLIRAIEEFEELFLKDDPLALPIFYRKFLNVEFHGTGHIFERMDSRQAFILLWIAVNVSRGEVINFNPILGDTPPGKMADRVKRVEEEAGSINTAYLDLDTLASFSEHLYQSGAGFVIGTGFQFIIDARTQSLDLYCIDVDEVIERLDRLVRSFSGSGIAEITSETLEEVDALFSKLEAFHRNHPDLLSYHEEHAEGFRLPERQRAWFRRVTDVRERLRSTLQAVLFQAENLYTDINALFLHARSLFRFFLPELTGLEHLDLAGNMYLNSSPIDYILRNTRKVQALVRRESQDFQDTRLLHKLAQREFGPMTAGTIGVSDLQIEELEAIVDGLRENPPLFDALIKSFVFQDLGRVPELRRRYADRVHPVEHAGAGARFLEEENIPERFGMDEQARSYMITLVRYHDFMHHILRGEFDYRALREVASFNDKALFDAFFVNSFIMLSSLREDLILEDLAGELFRVRTLCHRIMAGSVDFDEHMDADLLRGGRLYRALKAYREEGLPDNLTPTAYLDAWEESGENYEEDLEAGRWISALERIFRLRGIKTVRFPDLARLILKVPMRYIYNKRRLSGIGYPTFERELYEAFRIHRSLQKLSGSLRLFILNRLTGDQVRLFGFENVSRYLSYQNQVKLLLVALMGSLRFEDRPGVPISLSFLEIMPKIRRRYEALNDFFNGFTAEELWGNPRQVDRFLRAGVGLLLRVDENTRLLTLDFIDRVKIGKKVSYMDSITNLDQLKNYFHYSLQTLRKIPFYTDDYEIDLERAFDRRLEQITDMMLDQAGKQMGLLGDFTEIHGLYTDLEDRALDIGFTEEQRSKLRDLYELRKDDLKRQKLEEIERLLESMQDPQELRDYWDGTKWYLYNNRPYLGKEYENMIACRFDEVMAELSANRAG